MGSSNNSPRGNYNSPRSNMWQVLATAARISKPLCFVLYILV